MRRLLTLKYLLATVVLGVLLALAVVAQEFRLFERVWFQVQEWRHGDDWQARSLWLPAYRVAVEALPIEGLNEDLSALTYDPDRNTLFTVTNKRSEIIELSLQGQILRRIPIEGFGDPEAIEYISRGLYVITDERQQRLIKVWLDDSSTKVRAEDAQQLTLGIGLNGNKGFEGLAYDPNGKRLFVAKERDPVRIYEVHGFPHTNVDRPFSVHVVDNPSRDAGLFVRDLSSLDFDMPTGHLLALSDESQLVIELDVEGKPISTLSLLRGQHGLKKSVPQAEGIASDNAGNIYIVSEPNLFYVFKKGE
ncbi:MAG: SdiA-regulated domain-containing protein [Pseudomonas sp.]|uniref:SdiA-regulated domain-containing protein n=1 Tax=Pseudomonas sp. TaxID=306 RepID=UPI0030F34A11